MSTKESNGGEANEVLEKVASYGLHANMIIYLTGTYHMTPATAATVLLIWGAISNSMPIMGAFLADSWLGKFRVIALGCFVSLIGMVLLWLTAMIPGAHPPACKIAYVDCESPTSSQLALLFMAYGVMSIGSGGIRPCSLAFGADQFNRPTSGKSQNVRTLQTFFNWYYASLGLSLVTALTVIIYIQDHAGWRVGFGVPAALMVCSTTLFLLGSAVYIKVKGDKSILSGLVQVIVVSVKNREIILPSNSSDAWFHKTKGSKLTVPTKNLRFLNKACVIRHPEKDLNPDGTASNPWNLCTVEQVEVLKAVVRVLPIWSTGIMPAVVISQSFPVLQAKTMDRHIGPNFEVPAASFIVFSIITLTLWVAIYDRLLVPPLSRLTGRVRGFSLKQRLGIGVMLSCVATAAAAITERARRTEAINEGLAEDSQAIVNMSAMWLVPQYCLTGLAEAFSIIGQIEFYYMEFPKTMKSIGVSLVALGLGAGNLVASFIVVLVNKMSKTDGDVSWLDKNLNKGHYDYYYWTLTILGVANVFYFLVCSQIYGEEGQNNFWDEETEMNSGSELPVIA
ncbi:protein NRT1/ PTR FAMILY 1.2-like isoform X2 [Canna indica]|uniref:Protein NRT1/ PTR FAMILY 1.2-like isoform X2 n=1 Tax=Canna indica TaxID=4628 RepID=A0AAQ3QNI0_9LILI|nr:protein NRT1/ PTR FAMILY 1.2-like isoform X2 [Canna indica]